MRKTISQRVSVGEQPQRSWVFSTTTSRYLLDKLESGQCDRRWSFVSSALSAYLDKRNRFSEELGARALPVCGLSIHLIGSGQERR
jgi:hypothetical protein